MKSLTRQRAQHPTLSVFNDIFAPSLDETFRSLWSEAFSKKNSLIDSFNNSVKYPKADALLTENGFEINVAVPGIEQEDIEITFENSILTISSSKKEQTNQEDKKFIINELRHSSWKRSWEISDQIGQIEENNISASLKNGILSISIPIISKQEKKTEAKRISIS